MLASDTVCSLEELDANEEGSPPPPNLVVDEEEEDGGGVALEEDGDLSIRRLKRGFVGVTSPSSGC